MRKTEPEAQNHEQTDSCKRGEDGWRLIERRWRGKSKSIYEGHIDMDNGVGTNCGSEGRPRCREQWGKKCDNYNNINNKMLKNKNKEKK